MNFRFLKRKKFWWRFISVTILLPILLFSALVLYVYIYQDEIVQSQIDDMNKNYKGYVTIGDTHLAPFADFPYMSIKVDDVKIFESKEDNASVILDVADIYIGFDIWDIIEGSYDIQSLIVEDGFFNIIQHEDGTNNLANALATVDDEEEGEPFNIHLKHIELKNLDIHQLNEETNLDVETFIYSAEGGFQTENEIIAAHIDTEFEMNVISEGDTTYIKHKHFEFHTDITFDESKGLITFKPSGLVMEHGDFELEGTLDIKNDPTIDIEIKGTKPNFDMLIAFAPVDLIPILERYKNAGNIYFNAMVNGSFSEGKMPFIDAEFGASDAYLENTDKGKRIDDMGFEGHFTNGSERNFKTMEFSLTGIQAQLETGKFLGSVIVKNFEEPDVFMKVNADFNLEFLIDFFDLQNIESASGKIAMDLNFHDIIDLNHPERTLNDLNKAYYTEVNIENLNINTSLLPKPIKDFNLHLTMNGKEAILDKMNMKVGNSDLSITGFLTDLPAIIHHTSIPVEAHLDIQSKMIDVAELTNYSPNNKKGIDEQIEDLRIGFSFKSSAKNITESKYLPIGEFFIDSLHATLKHYPHEIHDFHVDLLIDDKDLSIVDFTGFINDSDFHLNGLVHDYGFWMQDQLNGDIDLDLTLKSKLLRLEDIFSYQGKNYVPEDYQHEEFDNLTLHVNSSLHFKENTLTSVDIDLDRLDAKMHIHPMRFENFRGRFHYEDEHLVVEDFHGKMGRTVFDVNLNYYLGNNPEIRLRDNYLALKANYIDYDQLFSFNAPPTKSKKEEEVKTKADVAEHAEAFNIYQLPFTEMKMDVDVDHFIYHRINLKDIHGRLRTTENHYLYVDTIRLKAAGGSFRMSGYFNGSDPEHIYLKPNLIVENANIDKLMFKFENFGQDALVSDNIHGKLSANISGNIRMYPDMIPDIDQSEIHMDIQVLNGKLENYEPIQMLSSYFEDKNLKSIKFDTLQNHMDITNGKITIPTMTIESTLGHYELSGSQDMSGKIEYYFRIPWNTIWKGARSKLFGSKKTTDGEVGDDEIIEKDPNDKTRYLNLMLSGTTSDYSIKLKKKK